MIEMFLNIIICKGEKSKGSGGNLAETEKRKLV